MGAWTVRRAESGGSDRLYAHAPDGSEIGWLCLNTGHVTLAQEFYRSAFASAVASWRHENLVPISVTTGNLTPTHRFKRPRKAGVRRVESELGRLLDGWHVIRAGAVGLSATGVDHLVVGPGGVFVVSAHAQPGARVCIDGERYLLGARALPYLHRCTAQADLAGRQLSAACGFPVRAHGMLVLTGELTLTVLAPPADAYVTVQRNLAVDLTRMPLTLAAPTVAAIVVAARRPATWARSHL